jgi:hypothetical protein
MFRLGFPILGGGGGGKPHEGAGRIGSVVVVKVPALEDLGVSNDQLPNPNLQLRRQSLASLQYSANGKLGAPRGSSAVGLRLPPSVRQGSQPAPYA